MRLSKEEIQTLKQAVAKQDAAAEIYLYGSRVDMSKKGGDILKWTPIVLDMAHNTLNYVDMHVKKSGT